MADTSLRYLILLGLLPKQRPGIGTYEIQQQLKKKGYEVTQRTIQRDLEKLSSDFPIKADPKGNKNLWRFADNAKPVVLPNIDLQGAITLKLAQHELSSEVPHSVHSFLQPYFPLADKILKQDKGKGAISEKIAVLPSGYALPKPVIKPSISEEMTQAVMDELQCEIRYQSDMNQSSKKLLVHPLAIVVKEPVTYLLAVIDGHNEVSQLPIHRITSVKVQARVVEEPEDFSLQDYIQQGHFGVVTDKESISLHLKAGPALGQILKDSPLSADQVIDSADDYSCEIKASVDNSEELKRWLIGWGEEVEVLAPQSLRQAITETTRNLMARYLTEINLPEPA